MFFLFLFEPQGGKRGTQFQSLELCEEILRQNCERRKCKKYVFVMGDEKRRMPFFTRNLFHGKAGTCKGLLKAV